MKSYGKKDDAVGALDFYEIERDKRTVDFAALERKASRFYEKHPEKMDCQRRLHGLSLEEM